ncbi:MAG: hypothetical protein WBA77_17850 [Microcoleaceae cyanobacterium]
MFEPNSKTQPRLAWILCISLLNILFLIPIINLIQLPLTQNSHGIISLASIQNISPYTDYIKYIVLLLTPSLITVIFINLPDKILRKLITLLLNIAQNRIVWLSTTLIFVTAWLINIPFDQFTINDILIDSFHQGEFLGFLPNFIQLDNPWINTVLIHGWGMDVFPSLMAHFLTFNQNGIALTRFWVNLESVVACIGYFWILWELTQTLELRQLRLPFFLLSCLIFCILDGIFFKFDGRRGTVFILQLALILRFFRVVSTQPRQGLIISTLLAASLPASFLYVYDRAIYFIAVYFFASIFIFIQQLKNITKIWFTGLILGFSISSITIIGLIGFNSVTAIISQVIYWGKYGRYISFIPLPNLELTWLSFNFWWPILIQSAVIVYLLLDFKLYRFQLRNFVRRHYLILVLLIASAVYMRITLDRSDIGHAYHGAIPTVFLVYYLTCLAYQEYILPQLENISFDSTQKLCLGMFIILLTLLEPGFNLKQATTKIIQLPQAISQPDTVLLKPDYLNAWQTIEPEISQQSCFFTSTSEGLWYYLFNKPSCSKYGYVLYAKPSTAQQEVIQELEETQPNIVLLKNEIWFQNPWDEILKAESASEIYQYILQQYRPYKAIESHWFWQINQQPITFSSSNLAQGSIDFIPTKPIQWGEKVSLMGWATLPQQKQAADAVYLSFGEQNQLVNASQVNLQRADVASAFSEPNYQQSGWTIEVPTALLPVGKTPIKVWAYDSQVDQLFLIGSEMIEVLEKSE